MKLIKLIIVLLVANLSYSQVGIETTAPTNTLDVNGGVRVRNLEEGTVQSDQQGNLFFAPYKVYAFAVADKQGNVLKQFGISSIQKIGSNRYRFTFATPMVDNDYIILGMGKNRQLEYDTVSTDYVDIIINNISGQFDFNILIIDMI